MKRAILFCFALLFCVPALATPPIWETDFGSEITGLTGDDDDEESVSLSFSFPFDGVDYSTVWVGTNGGVQLGSRGDSGDIDYDFWSSMQLFVSDNAPSIGGFFSDLDLSTTGTIHFNDFGDRAVFTWNEVGTDENEEALLTFQIQLFADGTIILGYNGIMDDPSEDLLDDLGEGIVVGISAGRQASGTELGPTDLSTAQPPFNVNSTEIYDRWCYDEADSCGYNSSDNGWPGPINTAFDLDQTNVVFTPTGEGSYLVSLEDYDIASFHVVKDFVPDNAMEVEVFISCNDGLPLNNSQVITEDSGGVTFIVELFTPGNLDCEITEAPVPVGYEDSYAATNIHGAIGSMGNVDGCQFNEVVGGDFSCVITNTAQDATYEVSKVWDIISEGGDLIPQVFNLTISCNRGITASASGSDFRSRPRHSKDVRAVTWQGLEGDATVWVDVDSTNGPANCSARERTFSDAVETDNPCRSPQSLTMGQTTSCTITNTVFYEGIPALNRYGLVIMALLMLGLGMVGFRRFA